MNAARCVRCRSDAVVRVREAAYCGTCYPRGFDEKLRARVDHARGAVLLTSVVRPWQTRAPAPPAPALAVAFSGSMASCVLLHGLVRLLRSAPVHGLHPARAAEAARIDVLYVASDLTGDHVPAVRALVAQIAPDATFVPLRLEDVYGAPSEAAVSNGMWLSRAPAPVADTRATLAALFDAVHPRDTPRTAAAAARTRAEDLYGILLRRTLHRAAAERQCAALLYAHNAAASAAQLLDAVAKGAGHKLPVSTAASQWEGDVLVLHPLRAHLPHELAFYAEHYALPTGTPAKLVPRRVATAGSVPDGAYDPDKTSMGRLAECM